MDLNTFNIVPAEEAISLLLTCCGSTTWAKQIAANRPYTDERSLLKIAEKSWFNATNEADWLEAFTHHPQIGNIQSLQEKYAGTAETAASEQASVQQATEVVLRQLAKLNDDYHKQNGFIFIVFATGKSALEMANMLKARLRNSRSNELFIAMGEQYKILLLRLRKLLGSADWTWMKAGQLTTHILDTAFGKPAANMYVRLSSIEDNERRSITEGFTNMDGRIPDFLPQERNLHPGIYHLQFDTGAYYKSTSVKTFYPTVEITFEISDNTHYHVPLLISPFGYSTYRGS